MPSNLTTIPAPRVPLISTDTGLISTEWYRFLFNLYTLSGSGSNTITLDELQIGPPAQPTTTTGGGGSMVYPGAGIANSTGSAWATSYSTTGTGSVVALQTSPSLTSPIIDGANPYITFSNGSAVSVAAGRLWYNGSDGSWNAGMGGGNITQQIGEELFVYGKASAAITDSPLQIIYHTGTVGASGVITFAPTIAGITDENAIVGVATENIALNGFGRVTAFGVIHGITTNGTAFGETWADDDVIWYNPVTGNPTNVKPSAPNIKFQVGIVINAGSGGSGSFQVLLVPGTALGGTDSNVKITSVANGNILSYDGTNSYWRNTDLTAGTGISVSKSATGVLTVTNTSPSSGGTVTSVSGTGTVNGITLTGTVTSSGSLTLGGTLGSIANSQLTNSSVTFNGVAVALGASGTITATATNALTIGTGLSGTSYNGSTAVTIANTGVLGVTGTAPVVSSGGQNPAISMAAANTTTNGYLTSTDWNTFNNKVSMVYPGAGIPNSTGSAWGTSYTTTGSGNVVLDTRPTMSVTGSGFTLQDATDNTKQANFELSGITTATTRTLTLPNTTGTLAALNLAQTFSAAQTFSGAVTQSASAYSFNSTGANWTAGSQTTGTFTVGGTSGTGTITLGRSTVSQQTDIQAGATASGSTKTINLGTGGLTGSTTTMAIGSTFGTSITANGTWSFSTAIPIASGGTGQITATAAFNALSPITTTGDLILGNGTNSATRLAIGTNTYVLTSNGTTASWQAPAAGGSNITTLGMWENKKIISSNYTIGTGNSAMSAGPITINSGVSVTVPSGSRWVVL